MEAIGEDSFVDHVWEAKDLKLIAATKLGKIHLFDFTTGKKEPEKTLQCRYDLRKVCQYL